jgi:hypothetical protein
MFASGSRTLCVGPRFVRAGRTAYPRTDGPIGKDLRVLRGVSTERKGEAGARDTRRAGLLVDGRHRLRSLQRLGGREIDQPFLEDDWVRLHRSRAGVVDPRRGRRSREVASPILRGLTKDGDFVVLDRDGTPRVGSRIVDLGEEKFQIRAGSMEEMERLKRRIEQRTGKKITEEDIKSLSSKPRIEFRMVVDTLLWLRQTAKIALAVGSVVYPEDWRTGTDAGRLREWLRGEDTLAPPGQPIGLVPTDVAGTPVEPLVDGSEHLLFFHAAGGRIFLTVVLLGSVLVSIPVSTKERVIPRIAWKLDPTRPRADGRTTLDLILAEAAERFFIEEPVG